MIVLSKVVQNSVYCQCNSTALDADVVVLSIQFRSSTADVPGSCSDDRVEEYLDQIEELSHKLSVAESKLQMQSPSSPVSEIVLLFCTLYCICINSLLTERITVLLHMT